MSDDEESGNEVVDQADFDRANKIRLIEKDANDKKLVVILGTAVVYCIAMTLIIGSYYFSLNEIALINYSR